MRVEKGEISTKELFKISKLKFPNIFSEKNIFTLRVLMRRIKGL